jgi:hypothetical protein
MGVSNSVSSAASPARFPKSEGKTAISDVSAFRGSRHDCRIVRVKGAIGRRSKAAFHLISSRLRSCPRMFQAEEGETVA